MNGTGQAIGLGAQRRGGADGVRRRAGGQVLAPVLLTMLASCADEGRMVGQQARHVVVATVTDAGVTLDPAADPRQVVYVLLQAIRDDFEAGADRAKRERAFDRQLAVCAPDAIFRRASQPHLGRDEFVRQFVWHWAPTLGHYRNDFPGDAESARSRIRLENRRGGESDAGSAGESWTHAYLELADPGAGPEAGVIAQFQLARESGYWRVVQLGFARTPRRLPHAPAESS